MSKIEQLKAKRDQIIQQLPSLKEILRSTISKYYLTCGYKKCRCHKGEKHGPFFYLSAKEKGKLKMNFVPKPLIEDVKKRVKKYNILWEQICNLCQINRKILWLEKKGTTVNTKKTKAV